MKHAMNFRLSQQAATVLSLLSEKLELSKTTILENALLLYFEKESVEEHSPFMAFAGALNRNDADEMLKSIYESRLNKEDDIEL